MIMKNKHPLPIHLWLMLALGFNWIHSDSLGTESEAKGGGDWEEITFFAIGDPQINIPKWGSAGTEKTIETMNDLPGQPFPFGGTVQEPKGLLIAGDLVDAMDDVENWKLYKNLFDPQGNARFIFPVYALTGNHDLTSDATGGEFNWLEKEFIERNQRRPGDLFFDENGFHYSLDWEGVHLVFLNVFPGKEARPVYDRPTPWNDPKDSLGFLKKTLAENVGDSGRPVILMWHYGLRGWGFEKWWTQEDLDRLAAAIDGYQVSLILHGHEHRFDRYQWNGYDVVMAPAPQYDRDVNDPASESEAKGFLVFRVTADELQMAHRTAAGWAETWSKGIHRPLPAGQEADSGY